MPRYLLRQLGTDLLELPLQLLDPSGRLTLAVRVRGWHRRGGSAGMFLERDPVLGGELLVMVRSVPMQSCALRTRSAPANSRGLIMTLPPAPGDYPDRTSIQPSRR